MCAATQDYRNILLIIIFCNRFQKSSPLVRILNHINPVYSIIFRLRLILKLSSHRHGLPSGRFTSRCSPEFYALQLSFVCDARPVDLVLFHLIIPIILPKSASKIHVSAHFAVFLNPMSLNFSSDQKFSAPCSLSSSICYSPNIRDQVSLL